ncbi:MAG TPA: UDP-N-acetylenolpyruvoylglucosamine reductase [Lentisphaeria bacterium]|nr:UDP-N-acetylenolpyruvoylglucosamine reductase [Lentisphaeria bacterium]
MPRLSKSKIFEMQSLLPGLHLQFNVPWKSVTTLGIGTKIPVLAEPEDDIQLCELLKYCDQNSIPVFVLGEGSNMVGSDKAMPGIVIRLSKNDFKRIKISHVHVTVGAGVSLYNLMNTCAEAGLGGSAPLAGIPGSLGGSLKMNAGARGISLGDIVEDICGFDFKGNHWKASGREIKWGYHKTSIPDDVIILAAICKFEKAQTSLEKDKIKNEIQWRRESYPAGRSAGCVFRNPVPDLSAGKLIDISSGKNLSSGDAVVSDKHANFLINRGKSTEKDFTELMLKVKKTVLSCTGIYLNSEVNFANPESDKAVSIKPARIALLKGGTSSEREVSLKSGGFVAEALRNAGYDVEEIDVKKPEVTPEMKKADIVFPVLHGGFGENGEIQKALEDAGISHVGCDSRACHTSIDKILSKNLMSGEDIPTAKFAILTRRDKSIPPDLKVPVVVKPPTEGSTVGISIVFNESDLDKAIETAFKYSADEILVEQYIKGTEITVGIVGEQVLPLVEIRFPGKTYDYDAKYTHQQGETRYFCPPDSVPADVQAKCQEYALKFFKALGGRDLMRIDMIIREKDNAIFVLESNNLPGFTESSLLPKAARTAGISFIELCARLAQMAMARKK